MIKPILKIEVPNVASKEETQGVLESLKTSDLAKDYHLLIIHGFGEYVSVEIITASDIKLHQV